MKNLKNKKTLLIAGLAVAVLGIAGTFAYNQDLMRFNNSFKLAEDKAEYTETFESPNNWAPCDVTSKTIIATNKGTGDRYVRVKFDEYWRAADSATSDDDHTTSDLDKTWEENGKTESYATIDFDNEEDWEERDGWYYYKNTIAENESTTSPIKSVSFNCKVNTVADVKYSDDGLTATSVPSEYANAKFHVYATIQMSKEPWQ